MPARRNSVEPAEVPDSNASELGSARAAGEFGEVLPGVLELAAEGFAERVGARGELANRAPLFGCGGPDQVVDHRHRLPQGDGEREIPPLGRGVNRAEPLGPAECRREIDVLSAEHVEQDRAGVAAALGRFLGESGVGLPIRPGGQRLDHRGAALEVAVDLGGGDRFQIGFEGEIGRTVAEPFALGDVLDDLRLELRLRIDILADPLQEAEIGRDRLGRIGDRFVSRRPDRDAAEQIEHVDHRFALFRARFEVEIVDCHPARSGRS